MAAWPACPTAPAPRPSRSWSAPTWRRARPWSSPATVPLPRWAPAWCGWRPHEHDDERYRRPAAWLARALPRLAGRPGPRGHGDLAGAADPRDHDAGHHRRGLLRGLGAQAHRLDARAPRPHV